MIRKYEFGNRQDGRVLIISEEPDNYSARVEIVSTTSDPPTIMASIELSWNDWRELVRLDFSGFTIRPLPEPAGSESEQAA